MQSCSPSVSYNSYSLHRPAVKWRSQDWSSEQSRNTSGVNEPETACSALSMPLLSLQIHFKFISSRELPIFNLESPTIPPDQLLWQTDITGQLLIIYICISTAFWVLCGKQVKNKARSLVKNTLHFGQGVSYSSHSITFIQFINLCVCTYFNMSLFFLFFFW